MATTKKRKKRKRREGRERSSEPVEREERASGTMGGMRAGFKGLVGGGKKKKESLLGKVLTYLLLAVALGLLIYRFAR